MKEALLTTPQVAARLRVGIRRVQALIHAGRLPSQQYGRDHLVKESDLALVAVRKRGRPPKVAEDGSGKSAITRTAAAVKSTKLRAVKRSGEKKTAKK